MNHELTAREKEVLGLVAHGLYYKQVAGELGISYQTVKNHIRAIFGKLKAFNVAHAVALAKDNGLI